MSAWYDIEDVEALASPALCLFSERVDENLRRMIALAGDPGRLWPHVKTHKLGPLIERQVALGITKFKCATVAEAELCARSGASDVLLAQQPVGPNPGRLAALARAFALVRFSTIVDAEGPARKVARAAHDAGIQIGLFLDLDVGQQRTGVPPQSPAAMVLYALFDALPGVFAGGLHAYDGHLTQSDVELRRAACEEAFAGVHALAGQLRAAHFEVPRIIAGGTPTFGFHAAHPARDCSPGTCVLWDAGYGSKLPDLDFLPAATVLTRVLSKPGPGRLTLDLGHKAIASEMPQPRAVFPEIPDATAVMHSEEHCVIETAYADRWEIGDALHAIPWHICPTVALHAEARVISGGRCVETWPILARARRLEY